MAVKSFEQLINNITGQLNGIKKMLNEDADCFRVVIQLKAVKAALNSFMVKYLENQTKQCLNSSNKGYQKEKLNKLLIEILK